MHDLYNHIYELLCSYGFNNMTDFCRAAGVPRSVMSELKMGRSKNITAQNARKFANLLGVSIDEIYGISSESFRRPVFPNNIRTARKSLGLTMKELCDMVGCSESAISQYETGKREPDNKTLLRISDVLRVPVDYLLRCDGSCENVLLANLRDCDRLLLQVTRDMTDEQVVLIAEFVRSLKGDID